MQKIISVLFLVVVCSAAASAQKTKASAESPLGTNLIKNGDAEVGDGMGWTNVNDLKTIVYGDFGGGPQRDSSGPKNRGDKYFYGPVNAAKRVNQFAQTVDVSRLGDEIDKGAISYAFGAWLGTAATTAAATRIRVAFSDGSGKQLAVDQTDEIKTTELYNDLGMLERSRAGKIPAATRKITLTFEIYVREEYKSDEVESLGYADNIFLTLSRSGAKN